jgi:hypothetical protein
MSNCMGQAAMPFQAAHLNKFRRSTVGSWQGHRVVEWSRSIGHDLQLTREQIPPSGRHTREHLFALAASPTATTIDVCAAIFAWGGMRRDHARLFFGSPEWLVISDGVRRGELDHFQGYAQFFDLTCARKMRGCGPAYYTKLLFFLPPSRHLRGVIMDQWTARSMNLLLGPPPLVKVTKGQQQVRYVSSRNDSEVYRRFCGAMSELASVVEDTPERTEMRLFSQGKGRGEWREYVKGEG